MNKNKVIRLILANNKYTQEEEEIIKGLQNSIDEWHAALNLFDNISDKNLIDVCIHREDEAKCRYSYFLAKAREHGIRVRADSVLEELNYSRW